MGMIPLVAYAMGHGATGRFLVAGRGNVIRRTAMDVFRRVQRRLSLAQPPEAGITRDYATFRRVRDG